MAISSARVQPLRFGDHEASGLARLSARRSGRRPLLFIGRVLLEAASSEPGGPVRHVVRIVELANGGYGYALEQWVQGCDVPHAEAGTRDTLPEVAEELRGFDASRHVSADISAEADAAQAFERVTKLREYAFADYAQTLAQIITSQ